MSHIEFRTAVSFELITFRVVEDSELTKINRMFGSTSLKLNAQSVLAKDAFELQVTKRVESSLKH